MEAPPVNRDTAYQDLLREFREITEEIDIVITRETDRSVWDGDWAESEILRVFVHWLPDIIRHKEAKALRKRAETHKPKSPSFLALVAAAIDLDPFYVARDSAGVPSWFRKRDHRLVPWRVANDPDPEEQKAIKP